METQKKADRLEWLEKRGCMFRNFAEFRLSGAEQNEETTDMIVEGTAITFNTPTTLYCVDGREYKEQISREAFREADLTDVIFNYNHGGKVVARTRNSTLQLLADDVGLHIRAKLDGTEEGRKLYQEIKGGYIDRMSFAFEIMENGSEFDPATLMRTITRIKKIYDVSAVDIPAYDTTSVSARNAFSVEIEKAEKIAEAIALRRKVLQEDINQTIKMYGGIEG